MLSGKRFLPNTEQLLDERKPSLGASFHFNNAIVQIDSGEREVAGHLDGGINVSAPFYCDYGYKISIGDNVTIGPGCQILDSGRISVGRNTKIGARVTISTLKVPTYTMSLKGSKGTEIAREVHIGDNVYIGDGCIIEAGVCIGNNAIVRAGSIVVRVSLPSYFSANLR
jgi:acetyltransferase-like isoleucine patch superfamily enzyme